MAVLFVSETQIRNLTPCAISSMEFALENMQNDKLVYFSSCFIVQLQAQRQSQAYRVPADAEMLFALELYLKSYFSSWSSI